MTGFSALRVIKPLTLGSTTKLRPDRVDRVLATASMSAFTKLSVTRSSLFLDALWLELLELELPVFELPVFALPVFELLAAELLEAELVAVEFVLVVLVTAVALVTAKIKAIADAVTRVSVIKALARGLVLWV